MTLASFSEWVEGAFWFIAGGLTLALLLGVSALVLLRLSQFVTRSYREVKRRSGGPSGR